MRHDQAVSPDLDAIEVDYLLGRREQRHLDAERRQLDWRYRRKPRILESGCHGAVDDDGADRVARLDLPDAAAQLAPDGQRHEGAGDSPEDLAVGRLGQRHHR